MGAVRGGRGDSDRRAHHSSLLHLVMSKQRGAYVPFTPGGSMVAHLASRTEERAWERLLIDASHMPYKDKAGFQKRGYTVELINGLEPFND